jgi:predicted ferric reductase
MELNEQIWWFVARSGAIVAWVMVTVSVCWGLLVSTRAASRATQPASVLDMHRFLGALSVVFTAVHVIGLVGDSYMHFGWSEVFVPMASAWEPGAVAWGIVAMYALVAVEISSLLMKRLPRRVWRSVHRLSLPIYVIATIHGLQAGTDATNQWFRLAMIASVNVVAFLTVLMILGQRQVSLKRTQARAL